MTWLYYGLFGFVATFLYLRMGQEQKRLFRTVVLQLREMQLHVMQEIERLPEDQQPAAYDRMRLLLMKQVTEMEQLPRLFPLLTVDLNGRKKKA